MPRPEVVGVFSTVLGKIGAVSMKIDPRINLVVILGPTASGKTRLGARLASRIGSEIISADSRQVYRGMDIGTGKDLGDYVVEGVAVPYHLIDIVEPDGEFSVYDYQQAFYRCFEKLRSRGIVPVLVGGSGMYLESVLLGYDMPPAPVDRELRERLAGKSDSELEAVLKACKPVLHNTSDLNERERIIRAIEIAMAGRLKTPPLIKPLIQACVIGVAMERGALRERIAKRLGERLDSGLVEEVQALRDQGLSWEKLDSFGLEYRYVSRFLKGEIGREEMVRLLEVRIGQFARRQMTWFRRMEKRGVKIHWTSGDFDEVRDRLSKCS